MGKGFNPFINTTVAVVNPKLEALVKRYAEHLRVSAIEAANSGTPDAALFQDDGAVEWLLERVDDILELEKWTGEDIATLGSLCFYLLTTGVEIIENPEG